MEEIIQNLRACLLSSKGGISLHKINDYYHDLIGERIPYQKYNFRSLEELLSSVPIFRKIQKGNATNFEAIPSEKTSHIASLVKYQKTKKRKSNKKKKNQENMNIQNYRTPQNVSPKVIPTRVFSATKYSPKTSKPCEKQLETVKKTVDVSSNTIESVKKRRSFSTFERKDYISCQSQTELNSALINSLPILDEGSIYEVFISHVSQTGEVYVQFDDPNFDKLIKVIEEILNQDLSRFRVKNLSFDKVYVMKSLTDNFWFRARVLSVHFTENEVEALSLDFGATFRAKISDLIELEHFSKDLSTYPAQAKKVLLSDCPPRILNSEQITRFHKLASFSEPFLLKVVRKGDNTSPPVVELFKRLLFS